MTQDADQLLVGLCREVMSDVVTHQLLLTEAQVRGYEREIHGHLEPVHPYERLEGEAVHEHLGFPTLPDYESEGMLDAYKQTEFAALNAYLRHGHEGYARAFGGIGIASEASMRRSVEALDKVFAHTQPTTRPITVYRGMRGFLPAHVTPGTVLRDQAYMSTSTSPQVARDFAEAGADSAPRIVRITVPAGERAVSYENYLSAGPHPQGDSEHEVLLPRGRSLRVTAVHGNVVEAELLPLEKPPAALPSTAQAPVPDRHAELLARAAAYKHSHPIAATAEAGDDTRHRRFTWEPADVEVTQPEA